MEPYRVVRHLTGADEAPWPSALVTLPSGEQRLLVDLALLPGDWPGWTASRDGHVLSPSDVVRREDGHGVLLPVCPRTVASFLSRRRVGRVPLTAGEAVTLAVSIVRGFGEASASDPAGSASWWLTDAGRPVVALGSGAADLTSATRAIVADLALDDRHAVVWEALKDAIDGVDGPRSGAHAEERMFAYAAPEPLADAPLASGAPTPGEVFGRPVTLARLRAEDHGAAELRPTTLPERLLRHVDADVGELVSRATTGVWRRWRERPRGVRPWLIAAGAAAIVLTAGALWPSDPVPAPPAAAEEASDAVTATPVPTAPAEDVGPAETSAPSAGEGGEPGLVAQAEALLDARLSCGGDGACLDGVLAAPGTVVPAGAIDATRDDREVELVDDYGGVAVLRVRAPGAAPQFVVIERRDDSWLLRDVFAAQQP